MYSANVDGSNMTSDIQADTKYIGIVTSNSETAPTNPSDYSWGRFVGTSGTSSYTWLRYSPNEDGSNMTVNPTPETKYIGVAITADNNAPTDYTKYSWALIKGDDGRGISKTEVTYQKSTSGTVIPTGTWVTTIPTVNAGEYLWTRTLFTYTDNTTSSTYSVARSGVTGLGILRSDVDYQKSTSGTVAPTGAWTATIPTVAANEYLWTRTTLTYTNATTSVSYSVGKMGADGKDAQLLYLTASSQIQAFDKDDRPKTTQAITISAKLQNASGTATFTAIPYIGNIAQAAITLGGTGNDRTLMPSQWTNTQWTTIAITATLGSLTDTISVARVKDGDTGATGKDGIAGKDGVGIKSTAITYAVSSSGTTAPTSGWVANPPTATAGQFMWTKTIWTYTDNTTETGYSVGKIGNTGPKGATGPSGPPTGVISQSTVPSSPYVGMLWQCTGNIAGYINPATYRWNGSAWEIYQFTAQNILAETFTGFTFQGVEFIGSVFLNVFDITYDDGSRTTGRTEIKDGSIDMRSSSFDASGNTTESTVITLSPVMGVSFSNSSFYSGGVKFSSEARFITGGILLSDSTDPIDRDAILTSNTVNLLMTQGWLLWEGAWLCGGGTAYPDLPLTECFNGWALVFSEYANGAASDSGFNIAYISKQHVQAHNGKGTVIPITTYGETVTSKYLYFTNTEIRSNSKNAAGNSGKYVLREVYAW